MTNLQLFTLEDLLAKDFPESEEELVEGFIKRNEFYILSAKAKTGKSLFAMNLALSVASGSAFLGNRKCKKHNVLLVQTELVPWQLKERFSQMLRKKECEDSIKGLYILDGFLDIEDQIEILKQKIQETEASLVILDPFYTLHKRDENSSLEMSHLLLKIRDLIRECKCAGILIHHQGKNGEMSAGSQAGHRSRGSSAFADVPDGSWSLERNSKGYNLCTEFRNRPSIEPIPLQLDQLTLTFTECNFAEDEMAIHSDERLFVVKKILAEKKSICSQELVALLKKELKVQDRTIDKILNNGVNSGVFLKEKIGRNTMYLPVNISANSQQPIGSCGSASMLQ